MIQHKYKDFEIELKDFDSKNEGTTGIVKIAIAGLDNVDSDGDIIKSGAANKTIRERLNKIIHLKDHNRTQNLGFPKEIYEEGNQLIAISYMNLEKQIAKDQLSDYLFAEKMNRSVKHSIGFEAVKDKYEVNKDTGGYNFSEIKLMEYSSLSFLPANDNTPFLGATVKQLKDLLNIDFEPQNAKELEELINELQKKLSRIKQPDQSTVKNNSLDLNKILELL